MEADKDIAKIEYKLAETEEERQAVFAFRYKVYREERELQMAEFDHERKVFKDPLDDCQPAIHYAVANGEIVATTRANLVSSIDHPKTLEKFTALYRLDLFTETFPTNVLSLTSRFMVADRFRGSSIAGFLAAKSFEHAKEEGILFGFGLSPAALLELYEQLGYRRYTRNFLDPEFGYRVPMVMISDDTEYFRAIRSPLFRIAKKYDHNPETAEWFNKTFHLHPGNVNARLVSTKEFWTILSEQFHIAEGKQELPLFDGLSEEEKRQFLDKSTVLHCKAGDHIIQQGETGDEMFVLLSGAVDILEDTKDKDGRLHVVATFGPGEIFGEMAFVRKQKRAAHVIAQTDADVLVLTQTFLRRSMKNHPEVTAKVLLNLSVILCDRLGQSTENWMKSVRHNKALRYLAKNFKQ